MTKVLFDTLGSRGKKILLSISLGLLTNEWIDTKSSWIDEDDDEDVLDNTCLARVV